MTECAPTYRALVEQLRATKHLGEGGPRSRNGEQAIVTLDFVEPDENGNPLDLAREAMDGRSI